MMNSNEPMDSKMLEAYRLKFSSVLRLSTAVCHNPKNPDNNSMETAYTDYHDPACEMARLTILNGYSREYAMENLRSVMSEVVPIPALTNFDEVTAKTIKNRRIIAIRNDFHKYCEFIRIQGGKVPHRATNVKYPMK